MLFEILRTCKELNISLLSSFERVNFFEFFTVVVDLLYPPRTSTCPRNLLLTSKRIILHQGTCPINFSYSTGGGKVSQP
eukprot:UN24609